MDESEQRATAVELLLREPDVVAWLDDYRPDPEEGTDDDSPPAAA